jgi:hypothetical protein
LAGEIFALILQVNLDIQVRARDEKEKDFLPETPVQRRQDHPLGGAGGHGRHRRHRGLELRRSMIPEGLVI